MTDKLRGFFATPQGKVALAVMTAVAVTFTLWLGSVPYLDRQAAWQEIGNLKQNQYSLQERLGKMETNIEWLVRQAGGTPR